MTEIQDLTRKALEMKKAKPGISLGEIARRLGKTEDELRSAVGERQAEIADGYKDGSVGSFEFHCDICNIREGPVTYAVGKNILNKHLYQRHDLDALSAMTGTIPGLEGKSVGVRPVGVDSTIKSK